MFWVNAFWVFFTRKHAQGGGVSLSEVNSVVFSGFGSITGPISLTDFDLEKIAS